MDLPVYLERVQKKTDEDEQLIQELEQKSKFHAIQKQERLPTLTEVLYNTSEEEMLEMGDITSDATNE